ncbi:MAG: hypothetical protein PF448_04770 [Bacteroidales bacterium]|jgi:hypothetical protein|nr:hypothetical protein [Bacteroidales bacterium]
METKHTINLWESLGKTLKRIEKHNAHQLDVDTALQQVRELYVEILKHENTDEKKSDKSVIASTQDQKIEKTVVPPVEKQETSAETEIRETPKANSEKSEAEEETGLDADELFNHNPKPVEQAEPPKPVEQTETVKPENIEQKTEKPDAVLKTSQEQASLFKNEANKPIESLGETLGKDKRSMNDSIGKKDNPLANKFQAKPIADIRAAINLGDRFLFIKELFNGNSDEFNQIIDELNAKRSFDEAQEILKKHNWDTSNDTVNYFLSIVQRKYIPAK